jgi:hypothetical protein
MTEENHMAKLSISSQPTLLLFNIMQDIIEKQKKELTLTNIRAKEASSIQRIDDKITHATNAASKPILSGDKRKRSESSSSTAFPDKSDTEICKPSSDKIDPTDTHSNSAASAAEFPNCSASAKKTRIL